MTGRPTSVCSALASASDQGTDADQALTSPLSKPSAKIGKAVTRRATKEKALGPDRPDHGATIGGRLLSYAA